MADQAYLPRSEYVKFTPLSDQLDQPWFKTVADNIRDALFPSKQPPLQLTSRPVRVRSIWGEYNYKKKAGVGSMMVHAAMIGTLIWLSVYTPKVTEKPKEHETITYVAPPDLDKQVYTPTVKVTKRRVAAVVVAATVTSCRRPRASCPSSRCNSSRRRPWYCATTIRSSPSSLRS